MPFLNSKKRKNIINILEQQFGVKDFRFEQALYLNNNELYLISKDIEKLEPKKLNIKSIGLLFGKFKDSKIVLSIEGAQIISKKAHKNIVEINDQETASWLKGNDIYREIEGIVLIKNKQDFLGCAKAQNNKILNSIPRFRRIK